MGNDRQGRYMDDSQLKQAVQRLKKALTAFPTPAVTVISQEHGPFRVLVSCLLSLRTRDEVTAAASARLFALADTPDKLGALAVEDIAQAIYPVAFYRNKAGQLKEIALVLQKKYDSRVPESLEELLELKGVGRKTANLTLTLGHGGMGICVDIHVHRIVNRWGYVRTRSPDDTEMALREKMPKRYWKGLNDLLVTFGQNICRPVSPFCSRCPVEDLCLRVGVGRSR